MVNIMKYTRKQFYKNFYNNHLFRDFLFVDPTGKTKSPYLPNDANVDFERNISNFLIKYSNPKSNFNGSLYSQVTYYKTIGGLRDKAESERYANMLFFDFDVESDELHRLKNEIKNTYTDLTGKQRLNQVKNLQLEYQNLLFETDVLEKPLNDAKTLYSYLKSSNINSYAVFSGSKGIHLYVFFDECKLRNYTDISYKLAESYKSGLKLDTLDLSVNKDAIARKSRVIYSNHATSNLFTIPIDIESDSVTEILTNAKKQSVIPFELDDYIISDDGGFVNVLKNIDASITDKKSEIKAEKEKVKSMITGTAISSADKDLIFSDMRVLLKVILGDPVREFENYNTYCCPFHDDNSPSARVYKNNFLCASENLHLNYFDFIRKYFNLADDDAVKKKMKELKKSAKIKS